MHRPWRAGVSALALAFVGCSQNRAATETAPAQLPLEHVLELATRERWMHAAQRPEFTPFRPMSFAFQIDGTGPDPLTGERTLTLSRLDRRSGDTTTFV